MKSKVYRIALSVVCCVVMLMSRAAMAEDYGVVVSVSSLNDLTKALGTLTKDLDPQISGMVQSLPVLLPQGLDLTKSGGLIAEDVMNAAVIVPTTNAALLTPVLEQSLQGFTIEENNGYLVATQGTFEVSGSPASAFKELAGEYTLAAKMSGSFLAATVPGLIGMSGQEISEDDLAEMQEGFEEIDSMTLGLNVTDDGDLALDIVTEMDEDSETAQIFDKVKDAKTMLSAFYDEDADAALQLLVAMTDSVKKTYMETITANDTTNGLVPALMENVFAGDILDAALSFRMVEDQPQLLLGARVQDGEEVDTIVAKIMEEADAKVKKVGKMTFYTAQGPEGNTIAIATHAKYIFLAIGDEDAPKLLQKTIAKSSKAPKESIGYAVRGFANLRVLAANPDFAEMGLSGQISITGTVDGNVSTYKIVADHECVASIVQLAMAAQAAAAEAAGEVDVEESEDEF